LFVLLQNLQQSSYAAKKAASQGLLDVALFLANVTELVRGVPAVTAAAVVNCFISPSVLKIIINNNPITICMIKERLSIAMPTIAIK
jgi:hypothetical protein